MESWARGMSRGRQGRGSSPGEPQDKLLCPSPFKYFRSSKQQEGQWSSLYRVISSVSGEDQSSES